MDYHSFELFALAFLGVLLHNLVKINDLNKNPSQGTFTFATYLKTEWASITISLIVSGLAAYLSKEVKAFDEAGKWLGLGYVAIGYMAQSILVSFMGKANKILIKD